MENIHWLIILAVLFTVGFIIYRRLTSKWIVTYKDKKGEKGVCKPIFNTKADADYVAKDLKKDYPGYTYKVERK